MLMTAINLMKRLNRVINVVELDEEGNRVNVAEPRKAVVKPVKPSSDSKSVKRSSDASDFDEDLYDNLKKRADNELAEDARVCFLVPSVLEL